MYSIFEQLNNIDDNKQFIAEASKKSLQQFASLVKKEIKNKYKVVINMETQCVDIVDENNNIIGQAYPSYGKAEKEYMTLKKLSSPDEIEPGDQIFVKRPKKGYKSIINGVGYIKIVSGIAKTPDDFLNKIK